MKKSLFIVVLIMMVFTLALTVTAEETSEAYSFAILKEIKEGNNGYVDSSTMTYKVSYIATLIIDGAEMSVELEDNGYAVIGRNNYTDIEAYSVYRRGVTPEGRISYPYTSVAKYEKTSSGKYVLTIGATLNDTDMIVTSGTFSYRSDVMLYTLGNCNKVILDSNSRIYYTYETAGTGDFKHLGYYDKTTITKKDFSNMKIIGDAYLVYNSNVKAYNLVAVFVESEFDKIEEYDEYKRDGSLILYAPCDSSKIKNDSGVNYYEYTFLNNESAAMREWTTSIMEGGSAQPTKAGKFYVWDPFLRCYSEVLPEHESFKSVDVNEIISLGSDNFIELSDYTMILVPYDVKIWGIAKDKEGEKIYDEYKTFTVSELSEMLEKIDEYNANGNNFNPEIIFVSSLEDENYRLKTIIVYNVFYKSTDPFLERIEVTPPTKLEYSISDPIDTDGMKVIAYYDNGDEKDVTEEAIISSRSFYRGVMTVTVTYEDKSDTFEAHLITRVNKDCATVVNDKVLKGTPTLDGKLDDIYSESFTVKLHGPASSFFVTGNATDTTATGTVYSLYDDGYVYLFFDVKDATLMQADLEYIQYHPHPHLNDAVEFRIGDDLEDHFAPYDGSNDAHHLFYVDAHGDRFSNYEESMGDDFEKAKFSVITDKENGKYYVEVAVPTQKSFKEGEIIELGFNIDDLQNNMGKMAAVGLGEVSTDTLKFYCGGEAGLTKPETTAVVSAADNSASPGTTFSLPVRLSENPGILGMSFSVTYADCLQLVGVEKGAALPTFTMTVGNNLSSSPYNLLLDGINADKTNGEVVILTFKVLEGTADGDYYVNISSIVGDENFIDYTLPDALAKITVKNYTPGDINGDGKFTSTDVTLLRRYIAGGYDVEDKVVEAALDINRDGNLTSTDVTMLRRYIAGGYGVELK